MHINDKMCHVVVDIIGPLFLCEREGNRETQKSCLSHFVWPKYQPIKQSQPTNEFVPLVMYDVSIEKKYIYLMSRICYLNFLVPTEKQSSVFSSS